VDTLARLARRHALEIHAMRPPPERSGQYQFEGLNVIGYGRKSALARSLAFMRNALARYDLVWSLWPDRTGALALPASMLVRRPLVVSLMGGEIAAVPAKRYGSFIRSRSRMVVKSALAASRRITVGSKRLEARLMNVAPRARSRARLAPLGVKEGRIARLRTRAWTMGQPLSLAAIIDGSPIKRPELLGPIIGALEERSIAASVDVFGASKLESPRAAVRVRGFIDPDELGRRLADYHALVHCSLHEAQGMALVEAASAGLPIACGAVGVAEELRDLGAPVEIAGGDAPDAGAFAERVVAAAARVASREAIERVRGRFALDACVERLERVLEEACA
jgi:hypothetical protein